MFKENRLMFINAFENRDAFQTEVVKDEDKDKKGGVEGFVKNLEQGTVDAGTLEANAKAEEDARLAKQNEAKKLAANEEKENADAAENILKANNFPPYDGSAVAKSSGQEAAQDAPKEVQERVAANKEVGHEVADKAGAAIEQTRQG